MGATVKGTVGDLCHRHACDLIELLGVLLLLILFRFVMHDNCNGPPHMAYRQNTGPGEP